MQNLASVKQISLSEKTRTILVSTAGIALCFALSAFLHFSYELSGRNIIVAVFSSVNESVWEHVKILLIPFLLWSIAEYYILNPHIKRLIVARCAGALTIMFLTVCFFFVYSGIWGNHVLWIDIVSAFLWIACGELVSIRIINSDKNVSDIFPISAALLCLIIVMLLCFSVSPPKIGLFRDPVTQLYGLETRP